jgi:hypothetical protein
MARRKKSTLLAQGKERRLDGTGWPWRDYAVPARAVDSGADTPCYLRQFKVVDMAWQMAHAD